ncbi:hypothetical protein KJ691_00725 [bacterium]|nr:hypothetical protein [bacterium]
MILKLLLVIAVIAIVYFIFIKKKPLKNDADNSKLQSNDMIECSACGIYSEIDDSILSNGKYYCSKECLEKR